LNLSNDSFSERPAMRRLKKYGKPRSGGTGLMQFHSEPSECHHGVFILDRKGHVVFINSLFRPLTGVPLEKIVGMHYLDIVSPKERGLVRRSFEGVMRGEEVTSLELVCRSLPGLPLTLEIMAKPVFKGNRVIALHGFIKNVMLERAKGKCDFYAALEGVTGNEGHKVMDLTDSQREADGCDLEKHGIGEKQTKPLSPTTDSIFRDGVYNLLADPLQGHHATGKDSSNEDFRKVIEDLKGRFDGLTAEVSDLHQRLLGEIGKGEQMEQELKRKDREIGHMAKNLQDAEAIQDALIKRGEDERKVLEQNVIRNMEQLIEPVLEKVKTSSLDGTQQRLINSLESSLKEISSSFSHHLTSPHFKLTPTELQVADFIRQGRNTKDIAGLMNLSCATVRTHRGNIRRKLDIRNTKTNLRSYLLAHF
jgi:PAS domain S-box-containing protein